MAKRIVFRAARAFDGESETPRANVNVFVEGDRIVEISERPAAGSDEVVECGGRVLMPGLIDAHVHVYAAGLNIVRVVQSPMSYLAHFAARFMHASLDRGFTTLRDVGGADIGLALAIKDGLLDRVPRLFYGGRVLFKPAAMATSALEITRSKRRTTVGVRIMPIRWRSLRTAPTRCAKR